MNYQQQFLVSLPAMSDNNFSRSVVYLDVHNGDGAKGWVINKRLDPRISKQMSKGMRLTADVPIYYGGPVEMQSAYVLHSSDMQLESTQEINTNLCVTRDKAMIQSLNDGRCPFHYRILVGHCSWGAGQLESEMLGSRSNGLTLWSTLPYDAEYFWGSSDKPQWQEGIDRSAKNMTGNLLNF